MELIKEKILRENEIKGLEFSERFLKASDVKKIFIGTSQSTIASWADKGLLTRIKIEGGIYYALSEILQLIEKCTILPNTEKEEE